MDKKIKTTGFREPTRTDMLQMRDRVKVLDYPPVKDPISEDWEVKRDVARHLKGKVSPC